MTSAVNYLNNLRKLIANSWNSNECAWIHKRHSRTPSNVWQSIEHSSLITMPSHTLQAEIDESLLPAAVSAMPGCSHARTNAPDRFEPEIRQHSGEGTFEEGFPRGKATIKKGGLESMSAMLSHHKSIKFRWTTYFKSCSNPCTRFTYKTVRFNSPINLFEIYSWIPPTQYRHSR